MRKPKQLENEDKPRKLPCVTEARQNVTPRKETRRPDDKMIQSTAVSVWAQSSECCPLRQGEGCWAGQCPLWYSHSPVAWQLVTAFFYCPLVISQGYMGLYMVTVGLSDCPASSEDQPSNVLSSGEATYILCKISKYLLLCVTRHFSFLSETGSWWAVRDLSSFCSPY